MFPTTRSDSERYAVDHDPFSPKHLDTIRTNDDPNKDSAGSLGSVTVLPCSAMQCHAGSVGTTAQLTQLSKREPAALGSQTRTRARAVSGRWTQGPLTNIPTIGVGDLIHKHTWRVDLRSLYLARILEISGWQITT